MTAMTAPTTSERERYRATHRELRGNAGIDNGEKADAIEAVADFGAAARRLRASVRGGSDYRGDGMVRRPVSAATRRAADVRREAEMAARVIDLSTAADDDEAAVDAGARAAHPAGSAGTGVKAKRFRLRSLA